MTLSAKARKVLTVAVANKVVGAELADAIDNANDQAGATGATGATGAAGAAGATGAAGDATAYTPGATGSWDGTPPTTIAGALDRIAAAIAAGATGPIA